VGSGKGMLRAKRVCAMRAGESGKKKRYLTDEGRGMRKAKHGG